MYIDIIMNVSYKQQRLQYLLLWYIAMNFKHPTISICCLIMGSFVAIMDDIMKLSVSGN